MTGVRDTETNGFWSKHLGLWTMQQCNEHKESVSEQSSQLQIKSYHHSAETALRWFSLLTWAGTLPLDQMCTGTWALTWNIWGIQADTWRSRQPQLWLPWREWTILDVEHTGCHIKPFIFICEVVTGTLKITQGQCQEQYEHIIGNATDYQHKDVACDPSTAVQTVWTALLP